MVEWAGVRYAVPMERLLPWFALAFALALCGCGEPDESVDAGPNDGATPDAPLLLDQSTDLPLVDNGHDNGAQCTCTGVSTCCDGCLPRAQLAWCHATGDQYGRCSTIGTCNTGAPGAPITCAADACHSVDESQLPSCVLVPANNGGDCSDGNATTFGDTCDATGGCAGTSCVSSLPCIVRTWNGSACVSTPQTGTSCDDGNVSTHTDECQANGACEGTPCECASGPCCDGCFFRGTGHVCEVRVVEDICSASPGGDCGMQGHFQRHADVSCSGVSAACNGALVTRPGATAMSCAANTGCFDLNPGPLSAVCFTCP